MLHLILDTTIRIAAAVIALLIPLYAPRVIRAVAARIDNATAREAFTLVSAATAKQVAAKADYVRQLKDPSNTLVGQWDAEHAEATIRAVIENVKRTAPKQVSVLQQGLAEGRSIDTLLRELAEAEVEALRRTTPTTTIAATINGAVDPETVAASLVRVVQRPQEAAQAPANGSER